MKIRINSPRIINNRVFVLSGEVTFTFLMSSYFILVGRPIIVSSLNSSIFIDCFSPETVYTVIVSPALAFDINVIWSGDLTTLVVVQPDVSAIRQVMRRMCLSAVIMKVSGY